MKKEFHAVLSFDTMNDAMMATYQQIVEDSCRQLYAAALLAHGALNDGATKPEIHLYSDDFLMGKEELPVPKPGSEGAAKAKATADRAVARTTKSASHDALNDAAASGAAATSGDASPAAEHSAGERRSKYGDEEST